MRTTFAATLLILISAASLAAADAQITVHKRSRIETGGSYAVKESTENWTPQQTAIIICDMWDSHHCLNAVRRCVEMAPQMNDVLTKAREQGVLIVHAPSGCMDPYKDHPGRKLAQSAPQAANLPVDIGQWCKVIPAEEKGIYPIDQTQGGEDDEPPEHKVWQDKLAALGRNPKSPWKSETSLLTIDNRDAISDSGVEIWNLFEARGIKNVILLGVHTNMCVLGRPFGLRQMSKNGKNVVLMRDMTDTMYDPSKWPYVSHFVGTHLIVEHIEKFVCPTITSVDFLGGKPFRFRYDRRKVVMLIGDDEYKTEITLPAFVESDLKPLGFEVTIVHADPQDKNNFPGMAEAIKKADVVLVSVRRRLPPKDQLDALRQHVAAGKPLVGIRTACHAWCLRNEKENLAAAEKGQSSWPEFDPDILGGHYTNHYGAGTKTTISVPDDRRNHVILRGVEVEKLVGNGSLYKVRPLAESTMAFLEGSIEGQLPEPVAWTNLTFAKSARSGFVEPDKRGRAALVFNTTLGHPDDFQNPAFRKLLVNGLFWALSESYVVGDGIDELLPTAVK
jgi:nicotinamidase-related amidase